MWFCVCFTDFAYICVRLFRTYTAFSYVCVRLLRILCGFCVRMWIILCASCANSAYIYGFLCTLSDFCLHIRIFVCIERLFNSLKFSMIQYWGFFDLLKVPKIQSWGFSYLLIVSANTHDNWTVWKIQSSGFGRDILPSICTRFSVPYYLIEFLFDNIIAIHRPILHLRFLVDIDGEYIYRGGVILLYTMLLCGSYNCRCKG